jgi:hypothetical protein
VAEINPDQRHLMSGGDQHVADDTRALVRHMLQYDPTLAGMRGGQGIRVTRKSSALAPSGKPAAWP